MSIWRFLTTILLTGRFLAAEAALPSCLGRCTKTATTPCTPDSLPALIKCLNDNCSHNGTLSNYAVTISPKKEYSCQQSYVPGDYTFSPLLRMTGQGQCRTSPYDFQSFVMSAGNNPWANGVCRINVYPEADCMGQAKSVSLALHSERCTFTGGRSARLDCSQSSDASVALHYIQDMCGVDNATMPLSQSSPDDADATTQSSYQSLDSSPQSMSPLPLGPISISSTVLADGLTPILSTVSWGNNTMGILPPEGLSPSSSTIPPSTLAVESPPPPSGPSSFPAPSLPADTTNTCKPDSPSLLSALTLTQTTTSTTTITLFNPAPASNPTSQTNHTSALSGFNSTSGMHPSAHCNCTSSQNSTTTGAPFQYLGAAVKESKDATIAAMFALAAAFILL